MLNTDCLIAFGSNLGNGLDLLDQVLHELQSKNGLDGPVCSDPVPTTPIGGGGSNKKFLNAIIRLKCTFGCPELFQVLVSLENQLGRTRQQRWAPRTVDLDILLFGEQVIHSRDLVVPHPRMSFRRFVLQPAQQVAADMVHPICQLKLHQLLRQLDERPNLIQVVGMSREMVRSWCTERQHQELTLIDGGEADTSNRSHWQVMVPGDGREFQHMQSSTKLVVLDPGSAVEDPSLVEMAKHFRGSQLRLEGDLDKRREVFAALDAMSTL